MAKKGSGVKTYNRILKEFSKINDNLPEDRKLSLKERRKIISDKIYPKYKGKPQSEFRVKTLRSSIIKIVDKIPAKATCDPNLIDPSIYRSIDVFGIDEHLTSIIPDCIYVKVNGGELFGETKIFNTRNYGYEKSGVRAIIENIREAIEGREISSELDWTGYNKLRPKKPNDGSPENYYIEYILNIGGEPQGDTTITKSAASKTKEGKKAKTKVTNIILKRLQSVKSKKKKVQRVKKSVSKAEQVLRLASKKQKKLKTKTAKERYASISNDILLKELAKLKRSYDKGVISKELFEKLQAKLIAKFGDGGEI